MKKTSLLLVCLFIAAGSFAQTNTGKITGTITDNTGKTLQAASVSLVKAKDSALVKLAITGKDGTYEFENIKEGDYLLTITSVGFEKKFSDFFQ